MPTEGPRRLGQYFSKAVITLLPGEPYYTLDGDDWNAIDNTTFATRKYYDLSGYRKQDLTLFLTNVNVQEGWSNIADVTAFYVMDLVTTEYITDAQILASIPNAQEPPGFGDSAFNMEQVVYGRTRFYLNNSTALATVAPSVTATLAGQTMWGDCIGTAADKLYLTRVVFFTYFAPELGQGQSIAISPAHYLTGGVVAKEPDLEYIMRLRRSYELQEPVL